MIILDNYMLIENIPNNEIRIKLPQSFITTTSTAAPTSSRRVALTREESVIVLALIKSFLEKGE